MTPRRVVILLIAGVALVGLAMWLASQRHLERSTLTGDLVLPDLQHQVNNVTEVSLHKGDGARTTLKRASAEWSVAERGWPADTTKVRKLLLDLGALNIVEEKTRLPANYPQLGVEDVNSPKASGTQVELTGPGKSWALIVGKSSSAKSGYVRVASAPQTLLAAPLLSVDADPKSWLERNILDIPAERVRQVEEHPPEGAAFSVTKEKKEQSNYSVAPLPKGRELSAPGAADAIAGGLAALTLDDVGKAHAADAPSAGGADAKGTDAKGANGTGTAGKNPAAKAAEPKPARALFQTFDGLEIEVHGHKDGTRALISVSARASGKEAEAEAQKLQARLAGWEFDIPEYKYNTLFRPLEELLKKPPEPAKKPVKPAGKSGAPKAKPDEAGTAPPAPPAH
jgi:hypothetical protein